MNICPFCEHDSREGAIICDHCGRSLSVFAGLPTREIVDPEETASVRWQGTDSFAPDMIAVMHLQDAEEPIMLSVNGQTVLGRANPDRVQNPDVDLSAYNAFANGVSSRHVSLQCDGERLMLTDLASTNGTCLNGQRLAPYQPMALRDGDEILLGALKLALYFESTVPAPA